MNLLAGNVYVQPASTNILVEGNSGHNSSQNSVKEEQFDTIFNENSAKKRTFTESVKKNQLTVQPIQDTGIMTQSTVNNSTENENA